MIKSKARKSARPSVKRKTAVKRKSAAGRRARSVEVVQVVIPIGNGWVIKSKNAAKFLAITDSKREAVAIVKEYAKTTQSAYEVYGLDGKVLQKGTFAK